MIDRSSSSTRRRRRGSLLAEVAMATVLLMIAMTLTAKVLGWVALERRAAPHLPKLGHNGSMRGVILWDLQQVTVRLCFRLFIGGAPNGCSAFN